MSDEAHARALAWADWVVRDPDVRSSDELWRDVIPRMDEPEVAGLSDGELGWVYSELVRVLGEGPVGDEDVQRELESVRSLMAVEIRRRVNGPE